MKPFSIITSGLVAFSGISRAYAIPAGNQINKGLAYGNQVPSLITEKDSIQERTYISQVTGTGLLQKLRNTLLEISAGVSEDGSKNSFEIYSYLQMLISQVDYLLSSADERGNRFFDKAVDELDRQQLQVLNSFQQIVSTFSSQRDITSEQVKDAISRGAAMLSILPGSKDYPRITRTSPFYLAKSLLDANIDQYVPITIDGMFLAGYKPASFAIGGTNCKPLASLDNRLDFLCPKTIFQEASRPNEIARLTAELNVYGRIGLLDRLRGRTPSPKKYLLGLTVLPSQVAMITIESQNQAETQVIPASVRIESFDRSAVKEQTNDFCANRVTRTWTIPKSSADPTVSIDTTYKPTIGLPGGNRKRGASLQQFTESAIVIGYYLDNDRSRSDEVCCSSGICRDRRAGIKMVVGFKENKRTVVPAQTVVVKPAGTETIATDAPLYWGSDLLFNLPKSSTGFTLTAKMYDGRKVVITPSTVASSDKLLSVVYELSAQKLILKPVSLDRLP